MWSQASCYRCKASMPITKEMARDPSFKTRLPPRVGPVFVYVLTVKSVHTLYGGASVQVHRFRYNRPQPHVKLTN